jgi:MYXO-CTERM domain-containing protein
MARRSLLGFSGLLVLAGWSGSAHAADALTLLSVETDSPTLHALGVQMLISDDDNRNATVAVRYRKQGDTDWRDGLPLFRVHPEEVSVSIPEQFAGSVFDLVPGTTYEIELHATDPDGGDETQVVTATTRAVPPADPATPNVVNVASASELSSALSAAQPGDVITLADGTYAGQFSVNASGTPENPIVIRGASQAGAILDGEDCSDCNVVEVYGNFVTLEKLTIRNAIRALRFQGQGTTGNVVRRVNIENVVHGIGSQSGQSHFTICDNAITGRLVWPWTFQPDATSHWDDRGVDMNGEGHVICHNAITGFGDPVVNKTTQVRAWDVYGNDIRASYDGTELDTSEGNVRLFHNRWTNVMAPISIQPMYGGPAYVLRNVVINCPEEQIKLKSLGGTDEPSGVLIYHNTFVSPKIALNLQTPITQHNFVAMNNLFVGPDTLAGNRTVEWTAALDDAEFDFNGYYPDGGFWLGVIGGSNVTSDSFAELKSGGVFEQSGVLLAGPIFESGMVGPTGDGSSEEAPFDVNLAASSNAIDVGTVLSGINAGHIGAGPDLGALERGCPTPTYGPRPEGQEGITNAIDCNASTTPPGDGGIGGSGTGGSGTGGSGTGGTGVGGSGANAGSGSKSDGDDDGGCGCSVPAKGSLAGLIATALGGLLLWRRRRIR